MNTYLHDVECHLPHKRLTNDDLVRLNPQWNADSIFDKTGIRSRAVAAENETASDLGYQAANRLLDRSSVSRKDIDALLFCTQSPDYMLPTSACILQERLGLPTTCAAFDFNLGCSGFVYGLWLAKALIASSSAHNVLLIVADTYSKYCNPHDLATVSIFGDGAGAALISADSNGAIATLGTTILGTDGRGSQKLILLRSGARHHAIRATSPPEMRHENGDQDGYLFMDGPEIFSFTLSTVHAGIQKLLDAVGVDWENINLFLLHQANRFMLDRLREKMELPSEKVPLDFEDIGNTVSATIPILLHRCRNNGVLRPGSRCVLAGFGVGYSWAMSYMEWTGSGHSNSRS